MLTTLLLHTLFGKLLRRRLTRRGRQLPRLNTLLGRMGRLLHRTGLPKRFPLLINCCRHRLGGLVLISTNLGTALGANRRRIRVDGNIPLNALNGTCLGRLDRQYST